MHRAQFPARNLQTLAAALPVDGARSTAWWNVFTTLREKMAGPGATMLFVGGRGTGKTQMAVELARTVAMKKAGLYSEDALRAETLIRYWRKLWLARYVFSSHQPAAKYTEWDALQELAGHRLLVIDDIADTSGTQAEDVLISNLVSARHDMGQDTILISNADPKAALADVGQNIVSRLTEGGATVLFNWGSFRART